MYVHKVWHTAAKQLFPWIIEYDWTCNWCDSNVIQVCVKTVKLAAISCILVKPKICQWLGGLSKKITQTQTKKTTIFLWQPLKQDMSTEPWKEKILWTNGSFKAIQPFSSPENPLPSSHYRLTTSQEFLALMCEHPHCTPSHSGLILQWTQWTYGSGSFRQYCQHWGICKSPAAPHTACKAKISGTCQEVSVVLHFFWKRSVCDI